MATGRGRCDRAGRSVRGRSLARGSYLENFDSQADCVLGARLRANTEVTETDEYS